MSQYFINAIDLPSGTLPTTPVVIKDNDLAGISNVSDYKYYQYGIPELTYIYINGDTNSITSTQVIQAVENGYYPIIIVSDDSSSTSRFVSGSSYPSDFLTPGIWGFSYYFYKDNESYAIFTCLQEFSTSSSSSQKGVTQTKRISFTATDYLGSFSDPVVDNDGNWISTMDLFNSSSGGGQVVS